MRDAGDVHAQIGRRADLAIELALVEGDEIAEALGVAGGRLMP